jgi:hypothetical protein
MKLKAKTLLATAGVLTGLGIGSAVASPIAVISGPYDILPGQTIKLSGASSYDSVPGAILSYAWDLDNDGLFNYSVSVAPNFTVGKAELPGESFVIALKVTDNFGISATTGSTVTVVKELPPAVVPEPVSVALFGVGALALSMGRRKRNVG